MAPCHAKIIVITGIVNVVIVSVHSDIQCITDDIITAANAMICASIGVAFTMQRTCPHAEPGSRDSCTRREGVARGFTNFATNAVIGVSIVVAKDVSHAEPGSRGSCTRREGVARAQQGDPA